MLDVELHDRRHALEWSAATIARVRGLGPAPIFRALWRRELVGSTALGYGVAIPHARIDGIERPLTLFVRPQWAIDWRWLLFAAMARAELREDVFLELANATTIPRKVAVCPCGGGNDLNGR